jgi:chlorophyll synthase
MMGDLLPSTPSILLAVLYSIGAHGIMTLNDFKALEGDRQHGVRSLPVTLGPDVAARVACTVMGLAQALVIALLLVWGKPGYALLVGLLLFWQIRAMGTLLADPKGKAPWYQATGIAMFVTGMMTTAFALRSMEVLS